MLLFLRQDLLKSKASDVSSPQEKRGEQRGGTYVARAQVGYESDGSPKYRYFKTSDEYQAFLQSRGKSKGGKDLETKVKKEHAESTEKQGQGDAKKPSLLSRDKDKPVTKSLRLFVRI